MVILVERIVAYGHENVTSRHMTTIEITKEEELTKRGDCIIGVGADKGICDLSADFKDLARRSNSVIKAVFKVGDIEEVVVGSGHPDLSFTHRTDFVIRKSDFICSRTLMIGADRASVDLGYDLVKCLKSRDCVLEMCLYVYLDKG